MAGYTTVEIGQTLLEMLERTAWQASPNEACALLLGEQNSNRIIITQAVVTDNVTEGNPETSFEIDPAMHILLQKAARVGGPQLVGVWHSHPNGVARPSKADREQSNEPGWVWLISAEQDHVFTHAAFWAPLEDSHALEPCSLKTV